MPRLRVKSRDWIIQEGFPPDGSRRRSLKTESSFPAEFLTANSTVAAEFSAQPSVAGRRGVAPESLDFSYEVAESEAAIVAIRYPSGALTFHLPVETARRGAGKVGQCRFAVQIRPARDESGRRSLVGQAIKAVVIKVAKVASDKVAGYLLSKLVATMEKSSWKRRELREGWFQVTREGLANGKLLAATPASAERSLLLIHGTFSHASSAYKSLAAMTFFDRVAPLYGDRIFAFDHFSLGRTPEENARMLLQTLPDKAFTFDVVTHSRGGLVLRNLVERSTAFGSLAERFKLRHAVLVASPNEGTPLATPARWTETIGWMANLLEMLPDNPFTIGAEFVANGIVWLAKHASGDVPGLHSMDGKGELIEELQAPPGPPHDAYSALVSNYNPSASLWQRMLDAGIDQFFGSANDLVVPSEGGWRVDRGGVVFVPGSRIGCYGPGGNLQSDAVTHVNFFSHPETVDFIVTALSGKPQPLRALDPAVALPDRRLLRSGDGFVAELQSPPALTHRAPMIAPTAAPIEATEPILVDGALVAKSDTFHLLVLPRSEEDEVGTTPGSKNAVSDVGRRHAQVLAHYGSARVLEDFYLGGTEGNAGVRWHTIIKSNERIKNYVDNNEGTMPTVRELNELGKVLFETLFPGAVRRLYDTARSLQRSDRLDVIFTSTIPWVADKPWEFAYDPVRKTSLATEDLHFIRNVMTAVPAEIIDDKKRLRILVVSSVPVGLGKLSSDEEVAVIRRGFEPLIEAGLADVDVLARATPASLHGYVSTGNYSVVHFIGHGTYDRATEKGYLVFQDEEGRAYKVDDRSVREIMCGRGIRLVFLNACETGVGSGHADFNSGVAPALVAGGVPIVVANQYKVLDTSATFFAQHFYWSLAHGMSAGEAAREARVAVNYSLTGESIDWAVPVVYARDPNSRLCPSRPISLKTFPSPAVRMSGRRNVAQHTIRVAVWDLQGQFPDLRSTLDRMNAAQSYYGFDIVDLSVPMDAWYVDDGARYLDADRFAERLAPQISQLGVHYISAIVNEWMACGLDTDEPVLNIFNWWPGADKPPVLIFSTKGLDLPPRGLATDRGIANEAVSGIAGYLMNTDSHEGPPENCPKFFNPERKVELITAALKFCKKCGSKLSAKHPEELKALNAILGAFGD